MGKVIGKRRARGNRAAPVLALLLMFGSGTAAQAQVTIDGLAPNSDVCTNAAGQIVSRNSGLLAGCSTIAGVTGTGSGISVGGGNINVTGGNIITDQALQGGTLNTTGSATVGGTLGVTGATTTNGIGNTGDITNSGNVGTATLSTTGLATLDSLAVTNNTTVGGTLGVTGATTTNGITNTGNVTTDTLTTTGAAAVGGTLDVTGQANLNGGAVVQNGLTANGGSTLNGGATVNGGLTVNNGGVTVAAGQTVSMGNNRVQDVAAPIAATDAANKAYVDAGTAALNTRINDAFKKIDENTQGIAIAIAMGGLTLPNGKNFAVGANIGFYDGKQAAAASTAIRLNDTFTLNGAVGVGFDGGAVGGRVGIMAAF